MEEGLRQEKTDQVLGCLERKLSMDQRSGLEAPITREEVLKALAKSENHTIAEIDKTMYELFKSIYWCFVEDTKLNKPLFDIIGMLTKIFKDIQVHDVSPSSNFMEGWMCPLYKKNDKTEIANYRPITCLNIDYKIMTKVLANHLAIPMVGLIHES